VHLAVNPPVLPMLAKPVHALPDGERWLFEPKWDGFRALVFRDADELFIQIQIEVFDEFRQVIATGVHHDTSLPSAYKPVS
jgi:hypothetical protein